MLRFEQYLEQFSNTISLTDFIIGLLLTAILALAIRAFYIHFGSAVSNRRRFANNFLPLALVTMLIITIVKSSLALSLGLVGALSIVRFRAAIKDPEELTYLFMTIGLGLATGANGFIIAALAIPSILLLLWMHKRMTGKLPEVENDGFYVNIHTDEMDLNKITKVLSSELPVVKLKRLDTLSTGFDLSYLCKAEHFDQIEKVTNELKKLSENTSISIVEKPELAG